MGDFRMFVIQSGLECSYPDSLFNLSARCFITYLDSFIMSSKMKDFNPQLPREIGEVLFQMAQNEGLAISDNFVKIFKQISVLGHSFIIRDSPISDQGLELLLENGVKHLEIINCPLLTANTLSNINKYCDNLISLSIDSCGQILPVQLPLVPTKEEREDSCFAHFHSSKKDSADEDINDNHSYIEQGFILNTPKLRRL